MGIEKLTNLVDGLSKDKERLELELEALLEHASIGIHITDGEGLTLRHNPRCALIDGIPSEEVLGRNMRELVDQGLYSESIALQCLEERRKVTKRQLVNNKTVLASGVPIYIDGEIFRVLVFAQDLTKEADLEKSLGEIKQVNHIYEKELEALRNEIEQGQGIITRSRKMEKIIELTERIASINTTILIEGESGVGKGLLTETIHKKSERAEKPFVKIDCGAIPKNLLESELFGYKRGSFTGASSQGKTGLVELASGGTLFLDEIGELPLDLQVKLLNMIQDRKIFPIGAKKHVEVDVRIIAATNRDLKRMVAQGSFREDLYYRLNVIPILIPPLRERREDIPSLIMLFLDQCNEKFGFNRKISPRVTNLLINYDWPGNVRELENMIERLVVTSSSEIIGLDNVLEVGLDFLLDENTTQDNLENFNYKQEMEKFEKKIFLGVKERSASTREMAEILDLDPSTIRKKFKAWGLDLNFA